MKIVEFQIPIPLKLSDYQRCSINLVIDGSLREMEKGSGLEIFRNERFKANDTIGFYTEKRYHLAKNLPNWLQSILGNKLTILTEKSWNYYPKLFTKYNNEVFPTAEFSLQTDHIESLTVSDNALNLNKNDLSKRQVMFVDLTKFHKLKNYDPKFDITKVRVGDFLPLGADWFKDKQSCGIISYKLLRLNIPYFGMLSSKIENYVVNFLYESIIYYTCMGLCCYDKWRELSIERLRATEAECYEKLNEAFRTNYSKMLDKNLKLTPVNVAKGSQIFIPKEISGSQEGDLVVMPEPELVVESKSGQSVSSTQQQSVSSTPTPVSSQQTAVSSSQTPVSSQQTADEVKDKEQLTPTAAQPVTYVSADLSETNHKLLIVTEGESESVRSNMSNETYRIVGPETLLPDLAYMDVVVNAPKKDAHINEVELSGPVPVMNSFDDAEFQDAVENLEDLEGYDQQHPAASEPNHAINAPAAQATSSTTPEQPAHHTQKLASGDSIDQATQADPSRVPAHTQTGAAGTPDLNVDLNKLNLNNTQSSAHVEASNKLGASSVKLESVSYTSMAAHGVSSAAQPPPKGPPAVASSAATTQAAATPTSTPTENEEKKDNLSYDIPITFTGYLYKLGKGFMSWSWNLRYIIVCGFNLYYFDKKNDVKPKDTINIKNSRISWAGPHMSRPFVFSITTEAKEVYFWSADEEETVKRWILLLQVLCEESPPNIVKQLAYELTYHQNNSDKRAIISKF